MNWVNLLPLLLSMSVAMLIGATLFRDSRQSLRQALAEGSLWSAGFSLAFSLEFLLLFRPT